jgi:hypothetical protein
MTVFGFSDDILHDEMVQRLGMVLPQSHLQQISFGIRKVYSRTDTIGTFIFKIIDDENVSPFNSPGVILSRQGNDGNQGGDTEHKFRCFRHFYLNPVKVVIIIQISYYLNKSQR